MSLVQHLCSHVTQLVKHPTKFWGEHHVPWLSGQLSMHKLRCLSSVYKADHTGTDLYEPITFHLRTKRSQEHTFIASGLAETQCVIGGNALIPYPNREMQK